MIHPLTGLEALPGPDSLSSDSASHEPATNFPFYTPSFLVQARQHKSHNKVLQFFPIPSQPPTPPQSIMSYAEVAASGPKQTPEEAAAPQPVELVNNESASTASLIDVDVPSVRTVPSNFLEQDVQTDTQAERLEREAEAAKAKAQYSKKHAAKKARNADSWITQQFASLSDGSAGALAITNLAAVIGVSSYLGYKAWGLYERGNLDWKNAGVGFGILAGVGAVEAVLGRYLVKGKKGGS